MIEPRFDERGLVPAIVQDALSGDVLMLAWMDREALEATLGTGQVHFHSRSRKALWKKGGTSGNVLHLASLSLDCDRDALLVRAHPAGPACHTGSATCWGEAKGSLARQISELMATLRARKRDLPQGSFTADLLRGGPPAIAAKLREEAAETADAYEHEGRERAVSELTDALYVALVMATDLGITAEEIGASLREKKRAAPRRRAEREGRAAE